MAKLTQGTQIYMLDPTGTPSVVKIDCPTAFNYAGAPVTQIGTTCLDALDFETFEAGLKTPGTASVSIDTDTATASHMAMYNLYKQTPSTTVQFAIGFSDGVDVAPTVDGSDDTLLDLPDTRSWLTFRGYISDFPVDFALNSILKSDIPVQLTGAVSLVAKA